MQYTQQCHLKKKTENHIRNAEQFDMVFKLNKSQKKSVFFFSIFQQSSSTNQLLAVYKIYLSFVQFKKYNYYSA